MDLRKRSSERRKWTLDREGQGDRQMRDVRAVGQEEDSVGVTPIQFAFGCATLSADDIKRPQEVGPNGGVGGARASEFQQASKR